MNVKLSKCEMEFFTCQCESSVCTHNNPSYEHSCHNGTHYLYSIDGFVKLYLCSECVQHYMKAENASKVFRSVNVAFTFNRRDLATWCVALYRCRDYLRKQNDCASASQADHINELITILEGR